MSAENRSGPDASPEVRVSPFITSQDEPAWDSGDPGVDIHVSLMFWMPTVIDLIEALAEGEVDRFRSAGRKLGNPQSNGWAMADILVQAMLPIALSEIESSVGEPWDDGFTDEALDRIASTWGDEFDQSALRQIFSEVIDPSRVRVVQRNSTTDVTRRAVCLASLIAGSFKSEFWLLAFDSIERLIITKSGERIKVGRGFYDENGKLIEDAA